MTNNQTSEGMEHFALPKAFSYSFERKNYGINLTLADRKNIRFAYCSRLPFRLLTGEFYRLSFLFKDREYEVVLINRPINSMSDLDEISPKKRQEIFTKAIILIRDPRIKDNELDELRKSEDMFLPLRINSLKAKEAFNHFLVAYSVSTNRITGFGPIRAFKKDDVFHSKTIILCEPEFELSDADFIGMFRYERGLNIGSLSNAGALKVTHEKLAKIPIVLSRLDEFVHYELAFDAKSKMLDGDDKGALITAVIALESVHYAFVKYELLKNMKSTKNCKVNLVDKYIEKIGIYYGNYMTPFLFMDESERPPMDVIENCSKAISVRNVFVHASKDSSGNVRTLKNSELILAYDAVFKVYNFYVSALENRIYRT